MSPTPESYAIADLAAQFSRWSDNRRGVSPLYEALVARIAEDGEILSLISRAGPLPFVYNRFMASVHYLLLQGAEHPLRRYYATICSSPDAPDGKLYDYFRAFCLERTDKLLGLMRSREVQINEVRRCAPLLLALDVVAKVSRGALALIDVGACAGLNLYFDKYRYDFGAAGTLGNPNAAVQIRCLAEGMYLPMVPLEFPPVVWRKGIDTHPIDASDRAATNWLIANVSPDDSERYVRLVAALGLARSAPCEIVQGNAGDVLEGLIADIPDELVPCVFHSFVTQDFSDAELTAFSDTLKRSSGTRPLYDISLEFERRAAGICVQQPIKLRLSKFHRGVTEIEELANVDNRGACGWIRWNSATR